MIANSGCHPNFQPIKLHTGQIWLQTQNSWWISIWPFILVTMLLFMCAMCCRNDQIPSFGFKSFQVWSFMYVVREVFHKIKKIKVCLLSKGGGKDQTLNLYFFGCNFGNIEHFIAPHLDTRSGLNFPRTSYYIITDAQRTIYLYHSPFVCLSSYP